MAFHILRGIRSNLTQLLPISISTKDLFFFCYFSLIYTLGWESDLQTDNNNIYEPNVWSEDMKKYEMSRVVLLVDNFKSCAVVAI